MSLRIKLLILFIVIALIPLGIAGRRMMRITEDELKSLANFELLNAATGVAQEIEDSYVYNWVAPLRLIKASVESEDLGVNEKLSLLTEGMKHIYDIAALQISVEGVASPLMVMQDDFAERLNRSGLDAKEVLIVNADKLSELNRTNEISIGDMTYIDTPQAWLMTIILPLNVNTFGRPAYLSARINLEHLKSRIDERKFARGTSLLLVNHEGKLVFERTRVDEAEHPIVLKSTKLLTSNTRASAVEPSVSASGKKMLCAYAFPNFIDWGIIVEKNEEDAYAAVFQMARSLILLLILGFAIAVIGAVVFSITLTRPLQRLTKAARQLAKGDLTAEVEDKNRRDEIGELSKTFNKMVADLNHYINELTETTKAKERAESELKLAWDIQQSLLPKDFPLLKELDVWGTCEPAREVGGDYFDFFQIDDDQYGLVIGDVSGKGVPASLFMAVSRTLFRILSSQYIQPEKVMTEFNDKLVALNQDAHLFITMFYGLYNIKTGMLRYSSAGHNMPYVKIAGKIGGKFEMLPQLKTMVAGIMDGLVMGEAMIQMNKGDIIFLYTDGMTEPINAKEEEFGEERLEKLLEEYSSMSAQEMSKKLIKDVKDFQVGMPQFDDMTVFTMKVK